LRCRCFTARFQANFGRDLQTHASHASKKSQFVMTSSRHYGSSRTPFRPAPKPVSSSSPRSGAPPPMSDFRSVHHPARRGHRPRPRLRSTFSDASEPALASKNSVECLVSEPSPPRTYKRPATAAASWHLARLRLGPGLQLFSAGSKTSTLESMEPPS